MVDFHVLQNQEWIQVKSKCSARQDLQNKNSPARHTAPIVYELLKGKTSTRTVKIMLGFTAKKQTFLLNV